MYSCDISTSSTVVVVHWKARGRGGRGWGGGECIYILSMLVANTLWSPPNNQGLEIPSFEYSCDISNVVVMHWKARGRGGGGLGGCIIILSKLVANTLWSPPNNQDLEIPSFVYSCGISTSSTVVVMHWKARGREGLGAWGMHIYCQCWSPILYGRHQIIRIWKYPHLCIVGIFSTSSSVVHWKARGRGVEGGGGGECIYTVNAGRQYCMVCDEIIRIWKHPRLCIVVILVHLVL